jgi:hypothetical protein
MRNDEDAPALFPAPCALNATFLNPEDPEASHWLFLDVLEGGTAQKAGIVPGDALVAVSGLHVSPPEVPRFDLGRATEIVVRSRDGCERAVTIDLPRPTAKGRPPLVEVTAVHARTLTNNIGRLISSLCPDTRPIGFNVSRKVAEQGYRKDRLIRIDNIPTTKLGLIRMFLRFKLLQRDRSVALFTEGLGRRSFHGRIAILTNRHTKSAAEMVADFAKIHRLATIVGTRTAGEVLGTVNFPRWRRVSLAYTHWRLDDLGRAATRVYWC